MNFSTKNYQNLDPKYRLIIFYALSAVLVFAMGSVAIGNTENKLILENGQLAITQNMNMKQPTNEQ